jgi:hypothetical protein
MNIDPLHFSKMLAKIAHATAIAILGIDTFIPALPEFIRGKDDNWANWVGACPEKDLPRIRNDPIVSVKIYLQEPPHDNVVLGRIRLFEALGGPIYDVFIGRLLSGRSPPPPPISG